MKKWLTGMVVLLAVVWIAILLFIPRSIKFSEVKTIGANSEEAFRYFTNTELRNKWLSDSTSGKVASTGNNYFKMSGDHFEISKFEEPAVTISINHKNKRINSQLLMAPQKPDSTVIIWEGELDGGNNPISRVSGYFTALDVKENMHVVLTRFNSFLSVTEQVYDFPIVIEQVTDTILIASRKVFSQRPTIAQIYAMVNTLEKNAAAGNVTPTNPPMLNLTVLDSSHYQCTVALPVNKTIRVATDVYVNKMVPGRILVETITGGPGTIQYAFSRLSDYFRQHRHTSPALHFESMITNRLQEADTAKWVTKIYYPIF